MVNAVVEHDQMTLTRNIEQRYKEACEQGNFVADSYSTYNFNTDEYSKEDHSVVFTARDGYHVVKYLQTHKAAEAYAAKLNSLGSVAKVDEFRGGVHGLWRGGGSTVS